MYVGVLPAYMSMYHMHAQCLQRPEESIRFPGSRVIYGCKLACGCWDSNLSLEEQSVILTTEPSRQPWTVYLLMR